MNIYWLETKRFIAKHKKNILIGTLIFGVLISGVLTLLSRRTTAEVEVNEIEDSNEVFENESRTAFFRFFIEHIDGYSFNNPALLDDLFNSEDLYNDILAETGVDMQAIKDLAEEKEITEFSPIKVIISHESYILTAIFETGDNRSNINIANFFYNYLLSGQIPILEDYKINSIDEPRLVEAIEENEDTKAIQSQNSKTELLKTIIKNLIIGVILGIVLVLGIILLIELFGKKLDFVFGYNAEAFDSFMLYDKNLDNKKVIQYFVNTPHVAERLILAETNLNQEDKDLLFVESDVGYDISQSIETSTISNKYNEIILIIKPNETTRKWYNKQRKLIDLHDAKTKIIQINNEYDT